MRIEDTREQLLRLVHQRPFRPFVICLENGDRFVVEHPENVALDPTTGGRRHFHVITRQIVCDGTLDAISSLAREDVGETVGA